MTVMDLRELNGCWAGCDGCLRCAPVVSADPEAWLGVAVPDVAWTDASIADLRNPAPEEKP